MRCKKGRNNSLADQPKPNAPREYDVLEAEFWLTRHVPPGSILTDTAADEVLGPAGTIAVLVLQSESAAQGLWLEVRPLSCSEAGARNPLDGSRDRGCAFDSGWEIFETVLDLLSNCKSVAECGVWLAWRLKNQFF